MGKKILSILFIIFLSLSAETIWVDCNSKKDKEAGTKEYPFKKISDAIKISKEGDEVIIKEGIYREIIQTKSGIKIKSEGRVIISGYKEIKGWEKCENNIWKTTSDREIDELFIKNRRIEIARYPEKNWLKIEKFEEKDNIYRVYNSELKNLKDIKNFEARILNSTTNTFFTCPVLNFNSDEGFFEFAKQTYLKLTEKDLFYLRHNSKFIKSNQWAIEKENEKFIIYLYPENEEDLKFTETTGNSERVMSLVNVKNVEIDGLEICGGNTYGLWIDGCENILIKNCIIYNNKHVGLSVNRSKNVTILKNTVLFNGNGVSVGASSSNVEVLNNEIAFNNNDGLIVSWGAENIKVKSNYIHHHILYGHPDNMQTYRNVKNLKIEDNLLVCGGQSIMMEETYDVELKNNIIMGAGAYSLIFGHQNTDNVKMYFNTVVLSQYGSVSFTGKKYDVKGNIFVTGHPGAIYGINVNEYEGDYNIFWNCEIPNPTVIAASGKWYKSGQFEVYKKDTQKDLNSLYSNPLFKNFPLSFHVVEPILSSEEKLYIKNQAELINTGDFIEVNFDGIPRKVIEKEGKNYIKITPELEKPPFRIVLVSNWGKNNNFEYNFDLKDDSPVKKVFYENKIPGSKLSFKSMKNCDFDNDGKRDLPLLPEDLGKIYNEKLRKTYIGGEIEKKWQ